MQRAGEQWQRAGEQWQAGLHERGADGAVQELADCSLGFPALKQEDHLIFGQEDPDAVESRFGARGAVTWFISCCARSALPDRSRAKRRGRVTISRTS